MKKFKMIRIYKIQATSRGEAHKELRASEARGELDECLESEFVKEDVESNWKENLKSQIKGRG